MSNLEDLSQSDEDLKCNEQPRHLCSGIKLCEDLSHVFSHGAARCLLLAGRTSKSGQSTQA